MVVSAFSSWAQPSHVPWPSYTDGVPDFIAHPSDLPFRVGAALLGTAALVLVGLVRRAAAPPLPFLLLALLGLGGIALGLHGFDTVEHYRGFGSMNANDMTLIGFRHGLLDYAELLGAALLCVAPLAALRRREATAASSRAGAGPRPGPRARTRISWWPMNPPPSPLLPPTVGWVTPPVS